MQQIVTPRRGQAVVGGRGRVGEMTQRPARRDRPPTAKSKEKANWRSIVYLPWVGRFVVAMVVGLLLFAGYRAAASASFFSVKNIDVTGTARVSPEEVRAIVRKATVPSGVWNADVTSIRAELEKIPWVRTAVVSRVLPDGIRIRITERVPYAVVHLDSGKLVWVDQDAVVLGPISLQADSPPFYLRGWETGWASRTENRARLALYQSILATWQAQGLAARVSELDLGNPKLVQVNLSEPYAHVTVKLLTTDYGEGLQRALAKLGEAPNVGEISTVTISANRTTMEVAQGGSRPDAETEAEGDSLAAGDRAPNADPTGRRRETAPPSTRTTAAERTPAARTGTAATSPRPNSRPAAKPDAGTRNSRTPAAKPTPAKKPGPNRPGADSRPRRAN